MRELLIATRNKGKIPEILEALKGLSFVFLTLADVDAGEDVEETGAELEENAILKARTYGTRTGKLTLADDTGLEVDALGGRPGVHSSRYAETAEKRNQKLLEEMKDVPETDRGARFRTVIALYDPKNDSVQTVEGVVSGNITKEVRGTGGFGYDPIFDYESRGTTGGEMTADEKQQFSHRARALAKAQEILINDIANKVF